MRNYIFRSLCLALMCSQVHLYLQAQEPMCYIDMEFSVEADDSATISAMSVVKNVDDALPFIMRVMNKGGAVIAVLVADDPTDFVRIRACPYLFSGINVMVQNGDGSCTTEATLFNDHLPIIEQRADTVYCMDSLVLGGHIGGSPPVAQIPCGGSMDATLVGDWVETYDCTDGQELAKIIYREYTAVGKDGRRGSGVDTIYVLNLPEITRENLYCAEKDTVYCSDDSVEFGPYMVLPVPGTDECDTIYLMNPDGTAKDFKCGLSVYVDQVTFPSTCGSLIQYTVQVKQPCTEGPSSGVCTVLDDETNLLESAGEGYWICNFWYMLTDTTAPVVDCGSDTTYFSTSPFGCEAYMAIPPVSAVDSCGEGALKMVKAHVETVGYFLLTENGNQWTSSQGIVLPIRPEPYLIIYEAIDICDNVGYDTCYVVMEDGISPQAVSHKEVNVSLSSKLTWLDASTIDNLSTDNCEVALVLARRSDWQTAGVNFCDDVALAGVSAAEDSLYQVILSLDKAADPVEFGYNENLFYLSQDDTTCGNMVAEAWKYALLEYATLQCERSVDELTFSEEVKDLLDPQFDPYDLKQLGGGWSEQVPILCDDVCSTVTVELLVVDYWCNWSKNWTNVIVEDKSTPLVAKEITDNIEVTCKTFNEEKYLLGGLPASAQDLVDAAGSGDEEALDALNEIFGTYQKVWLNDFGALVDAEGNELVCEIPFEDSICDYGDDIIDFLAGNWEEVDASSYYMVQRDTFLHGAVLVNCAQNVQCVQEIEADLDDCGQGVITRTWKIWKECTSSTLMHVPDTFKQTQEIHVVEGCGLAPWMFTVPADDTIEVCVLRFNPDGSVMGAGDPDSTGRPTFIGDPSCRQVGVGFFDKVLDEVDDATYCHRVIRTWCFTDWCENDDLSIDDWVGDLESDNVYKYEQEILVICTCTCFLGCDDLRDTSFVCDDIPDDVTDLYVYFNTPVIVPEEPEVDCDGFSLESVTVADTNECGLGQITRTWYLIDEMDMRVDSCSETLNLLGADFTTDRETSYEGDAEPFNCSDVITMDPIVPQNVCDKLGTLTITNDSEYADDGGADASGEYPVGVHYVTYTISAVCLDPIMITDTVTVIDDVDPTVTAFSDPCISFDEWDSDFGGDPLNPMIRTQLAVEGEDNCGVDTVILFSLDSTFFPDQMTRDSILYTYSWIAIDSSGNTSDIRVVTLLISDLCNISANSPAVSEITDEVVDNNHQRQESDPEKMEGAAGRPNGTTRDAERILKLHQNYPNPFDAQTKIPFELNYGSELTLTIYDVTGKTLKEITGDFGKGYHEVEIKRSSLPHGGILYYKIETEYDTETRRMILIE